MPIIRKLRVNGALYIQAAAPVFNARLSRYTAKIKHDDGREQDVYSRLPDGPFVFTVPNSESPHP
jgi:hypothetical protein